MSDGQRNSEWSSSHTNRQLVIPPLRGQEKETTKASTKQAETDPSYAEAWNGQRNNSIQGKSDSSGRTGSWSKVSSHWIRMLPDNLPQRHNDHKTWCSEPVNFNSQRLDRQTGCISKNEPFDMWGSYEPNGDGETRKANQKNAMAEDDEDDLQSARHDVGPTR